MNNNHEVRMLVVGDVMLDRRNRQLMDKFDERYFTEKIKVLFEERDVVLINLEGPVTNRKSVSLNKLRDDSDNFCFTFDRQHTLNFLQTNRVNLVNIGNNHILNFHNDGLKQTRDFLNENKIDFFGDPFDLDKSYIVKNINGREIAFVSYSRFKSHLVEDIIKVIKQVRKTVDFVMVCAHWGREYKLVESELQKKRAYQFIDAGADLIIGSHPHVVQPIEIYKDKAIFYSLGNFIFDQYFSENVKSTLGLGVLLSEEKISFRLVPLYMQKTGQLEVMVGNQKQKFLQNLMERSKMSDRQKNNILESEGLTLMPLT